MKRVLSVLFFIIFSISVGWAQNHSEFQNKFSAVCREISASQNYSDMHNSDVLSRLSVYISDCDSVLVKNPSDQTAIAEKAIWENCLASFLADYSSVNRYEISSIVPGSPIDIYDVTTWDGCYFDDQILQHFKNSLCAADVLQHIHILEYKDLLDSEYNYEYLPTLCNFLAYKYAYCLAHFNTWNAHPFLYNDTNLLAPSEQFVKYEIPCLDSLSSQYQFLLLCQKMEKANWESGYVDAKLFWNVQRIRFLLNCGINTVAAANALQQLEARYPHSKIGRTLCVELANLYMQDSRVDALDHAHDYLVKAGAYDDFISKDGGWSREKTWREWFTAPSATFKLASSTYPGPQPLYIESRQTDSLYLYVVKPKTLRKNGVTLRRQDIVFDTLIRIHRYSKYGYDTTLVMFPSLSEGTYAMHIRETPFFTKDEEEHHFPKDEWESGRIFGIRSTLSMDITANNRITMLAADSRDGSPKAKARFRIEIDEYLNFGLFSWRGYLFVKNIRSKKDGRATSTLNPYHPHLIYGNGHYQHQYAQERKNKFHFTSIINTDRSIYRPGQTVYYKAIIQKRNVQTMRKRLLVDKKVQVAFMQKGEYLFKDTLCTNDFGSVAGCYVLPENMEPGDVQICLSTLRSKQVTLKKSSNRHRCWHYHDSRYRASRRWMYRNDMGVTGLRVEEYKRPQFEIALEKPDEMYALGDSIRIRGHVNAYAGYSLMDIDIKYSISGGFVVNTGTVRSDSNGDFEICFSSAKESGMAQAEYTIIATAVDATGETQEAQVVVEATTKPYDLKVSLPEIYFEEEWPARKVEVSALNHAGNPQNVKAHYRIEKLVMPDHFMHAILFSYSRANELGEEFAPWDFNNETLPSNWTVEAVMMEGDIDIAGNAQFALPSFPSGSYRIVVTSKYSDSKEVINNAYFSVGHLGDTLSPKYDGVWAWVDKEQAHAGDTLHFHVGTVVPNATIFVDLFNGKEHLQSFNVAHSQHYAFDYVVKSEDTVRIRLIANCMHLGEGFTADAETQLLVSPAVTYEWETFRNELAPGEQTTFRLRLVNSDGTPIDAEVLCTMYDASLDVFAPCCISDFSLPPLNFRPLSQRNSYEPLLFDHHSNSISYRQLTSAIFVPDWRCGAYLHSGATYGIGGGTHGLTVLDADAVLVTYQAPVFEADATTTSVRGNRSDGQITIIDGVVVRGKLESASGVTSLDGKMSSVRSGSAADAAALNELIVPRTNFAETAFFYPFLRTDENGIVEIKFTAPESLTRWNIKGLAHTKALTSCIIFDTLCTSKPLMAVTNLPRFAYESDTLLFSAKVINAKAEKQSGTAELRVTDDAGREIAVSAQDFAVDGESQFLFRFPVAIPNGAGALTFRFVARSQAGNTKFSDGEERTIPVLSRRLLVSESAPFFNTKSGSKKFIFNNLPTSDDSLASYRLVFTPQPAWNALTALPMLLHPAYESNDQICNQLIGSAMLLQIASNTGLRNWVTTEADSVRQAEVEARRQLWTSSPWLFPVRTVEDENMQLEMLLKEDRLQQRFNQAQRNLTQGQNADGGWPWFKGGRSNTFITRRILIEIGRAQHLGWGDDLKKSTYKALQWDSRNVKKHYEWLKEKHPESLQGKVLSYDILHYLFARSYYMDDRHFTTEADRYYMQKLTLYARDLPTWYEQTMAALTLFADGDTMTAKVIMEEIRRAARHDDELGMYWKDEPSYGFWSRYFSPVERQSLLIEAFEKILNDEESVREMKLWLLQQKRGQQWENPTVTTDACMTLLTDYQNVESDNADTVSLRIGDFSISVADTLQMPIWRDLITENIGGEEVALTQTGDGFSYGTLQWQRWQELDGIAAEGKERPLSVERYLWRVAADERGEVFEPVTPETVLHPGDRVRIQLVVRTDRDMEYVWLKDLHSAAFDAPLLSSGFRYEDCPHYRAVRDEAVSYFFEELPKGKHTFEYTMFVTQSGTFSDGYAEVKSIYNPEFSGHSAAKGKVKIEK